MSLARVTALGQLAFCCLMASTFVVAGCGSGKPRTAPVRGTISYKGSPVPNGTVLFIPEGGTTATGEIMADGSYTLTTFRKGDGAILGTHTVVITALQDMGGRLPEDRSPLPPPIIPPRYMHQGSSGLQAEVKDQANVIDFVLEDDKRK